MSKETTNGANPDDRIIHNTDRSEAEYDWNKYQQQVLNKWIDKCGTMEQAIVDMDAMISSLEVTASGLREMVDWCKDCGDEPCKKCEEEG